MCKRYAWLVVVNYRSDNWISWIFRLKSPWVFTVHTLNSFLRTNPSLFSLPSPSGWFLNVCFSVLYSLSLAIASGTVLSSQLCWLSLLSAVIFGGRTVWKDISKGFLSRFRCNGVQRTGHVALVRKRAFNPSNMPIPSLAHYLSREQRSLSRCQAMDVTFFPHFDIPAFRRQVTIYFSLLWQQRICWKRII
jgi:hypothetical protein